VSYEAAMVNNDIAAIALYSWLVYLFVITLRDGASRWRAALIGMALGIALLAKSTAITAAPLAAVTLWFAPASKDWRPRFERLGIAAAVAAIITAPWYAFLYGTYGNFSGLDQLAAFQTGLTREDTTFLQLLFSGQFAAERWRETWGEFGWRLIPVDGWLLSAVGIVAAASGVGLLSAVLVACRRRRWANGATDPDADADAVPASGWRGGALLLLAMTCAVSYAAVAQFGSRFVLAQARYFFPAINAAAVLLLLGIRMWIPERWHVHALPVLVLGVFALNLVIFSGYAVPFWYFRS
jgi:4-amino-4-deoxy-L-arabinose transferase-like glycosyltransferase